MTNHNRAIKADDWQTVKGKLISRYGTIRVVASKLGCHYNSVRYSKDFRKQAEALLKP